MKKFIIAIFIGLSLLLSPFSIKAESPAIQTLNEQYKAVLLQLIDLLIQKIHALQAQIDLLLADQQTITQPLQQVASNTQTFVGNTPVTPKPEIPQPVKLTLISGGNEKYSNSHVITFVNPTSHSLKINFLNLTANYATGTFQIHLGFPNSADANSSYPFGDNKFSNYTATVYHRACPTGHSEDCVRSNINIPENIVKPSETVMIRASLANIGVEPYLIHLTLNYAEGSITDLANNNILFDTTLFSN